MPVDFERNVYCLLGLPFDNVDMTRAIVRLREASGEPQPLFLSTPNSNFLVAAQKDAGFRASVINSDLNIMDGAPLVWMARLLGLPMRDRVAGSSLFERLRNDTNNHPISVYFLGGPPGIAAQAAARLNAENRAMRCVGFECPGFGSIEEMSGADVVDRINASGADFLVVALGAKKGQAWIVRNRDRLRVRIVSHLGAVVNFVAGTVRRAPEWTQRCGLEWMWRIKEEPALWRRYWQDAIDLGKLLVTRLLPARWYWLLHQPNAAQLARASVEIAINEGVAIIRVAGAWNGDNLAALRRGFLTATQLGLDVTLDLSAVSHVDAAFIGLLTLLHGHQACSGKCLVFESIPAAIRRIFKLSCVDYMLDSQVAVRCD